MFSRYTAGMHYGTHVDDAFINGGRTDISFTLFLSDPDDYKGGELVLNKHDGDEPIKLPKGAMVIYPSTHLHPVAEITQGERLALVGWFQSRVRSAEKRELLFDLKNSLIQLSDNAENKNARLQ